MLKLIFEFLKPGIIGKIWEHNREKIEALPKSIIGRLWSIIGASLNVMHAAIAVYNPFNKYTCNSTCKLWIFAGFSRKQHVDMKISSCQLT